MFKTSSNLIKVEKGIEIEIAFAILNIHYIMKEKEEKEEKKRKRESNNRKENKWCLYICWENRSS